jgi:hypothetical protein
MKAYFLGVDPAPAFGKKNDDGALVGAKAWPRGQELTSNPADWHFGYIWAYRLRAASIEEWSGLIHKKHRQFNFTKIVMDIGAGGGGQFIMRQLRNAHQLIDQVDTQAKPIVTVDDVLVYDGYPVLHMLRRKDPGVEQLWPMLGGDDNLVDAVHTAYRQGIELGNIAFPRPHDEVPKDASAQWSEEAAYASKLLSNVTAQLENVQVATNPDGSWKLTSRGAKQFFASGKKDMAYAAIFAYVAFQIWLTTGDFTPEESAEDGFVGC